MSDTITATIPAGMVYSWESQVRQYPLKDRPGVQYYKGVIDLDNYVDCLLYRDLTGAVVGILNHYNKDNPWERAGNVNIWVHPDHTRKRIATLLWQEARHRWNVTLVGQRFTPAGAALANALRAEGRA